MGSVKTGVALPEDVMKEFDRLIKSLGYKSRSRAFQDAVQLFISMHKWVDTKGYIAGCVVVIYDHGEHGVEEELTDIQHKYLNVISAAMHVHLSSNLCMLIIAVRGDVEVVKRFHSELGGIKGVRHIQTAFTVLPGFNNG